MTAAPLTETLHRSATLNGFIAETWAALPAPVQARQRVVSGLSGLSIDHAIGLQALLAVLPASAIALLRLQFETLVRATWAWYAAEDRDLDTLVSPLTPTTEQAARKLPMVGKMLSAISETAPEGASQLLARANSRLGHGLNSFVHGGIHPFARRTEGYPDDLLLDVLRNSNGMSMLTLILLAEIAGDDGIIELVRALNAEFRDALPSIEP